MKQIISLILISLYITNIHTPVDGSTSAITPHLLFHFTHCNIFHLLCNLICLWNIKGNLHLIPAYLIATAASFLMLNGSPVGTQGFSAILLAIIGYKWGKWFAQPHTTHQRTSALKRIAKYILLPTAVCAFIPNVNASIHFYSFTLALILAGVPTPINRLWKQENKQ